MSPERKENLQAADELTRMTQENDALLATSKRLIEELKALTQRAEELAKKHIELMDSIKRRRAK